jgi:murein DD-endopeptidase MepM/ murein hydrolase activator NlpD
LGVGGGPLWEVQWLPGAGGRVRRLTLTRRSLRNSLIALGAATLLLLAVMGVIPLGLRGLLQRFTVSSARQENQMLKVDGERLREQALTMARRLNTISQRGRRLAWALGVPASAADAPVGRPPGQDAPDAELLAWLSAGVERVARVGAALAAARGAPPCPLGSLPTLLPVRLDRAVPVGQFGFHTSPFTGREEASYGTTLAAPLGEPVVAPGGARVLFAGTVHERRVNEWTRFGTIVVLDHGGGVYSVLGHLRDAAVKRGQAVTRGQRIGSVGQTGWTRVPALYLEIRWPPGDISRPIDPALLAVALPVDDLDARLANPYGDLPGGFPLLDHLPRR